MSVSQIYDWCVHLRLEILMRWTNCSQLFLFFFFHQDGLTSLHAAALNGHCQVVKVLLKASADLKAVDNVRWLSGALEN